MQYEKENPTPVRTTGDRVPSGKLSADQAEALQDLLRQRAEAEHTLETIVNSGDAVSIFLDPLGPVDPKGQEPDFVQIQLKLPYRNIPLDNVGAGIRQVVEKMLYEQLCALTAEIRNVANS